jgi:ABC-type lipoprotein export system ATPase subunit
LLLARRSDGKEKKEKKKKKEEKEKKFKGKKATTRKIHELAGGETNWIAFHIYVYIYTLSPM